jgi:hypothetical protein
MSKTLDRRVRVALTSLAAIGLAMAAASPALADTATPATPTNLLNGGQACVTDQSAAQYFNTNNYFELEGAPALSDGSPTARRPSSTSSGRSATRPTSPRGRSRPP